jgi:hypothetical protein
MSGDYTGLHGRSPWEPDYPHPRGAVIDEHYDGDHAVPEHWEELNRGICPWCGRTVTWDETQERWILDPSLTVLVLTRDEMETLRVLKAAHATNTDELMHVVEWQHELNGPFEDDAVE